VAFDDADVSTTSNGQSGNRHSGKSMLFVLIRHVGAARNSAVAAATDSASGRRSVATTAAAAELPRRMEPVAGKR
jgi:hypothetical protein